VDWTLRDAEVIQELNDLIEKRPSRGFWKCYKIIRRQQSWNHKRVYRVYCQMKLNQRRRSKKRAPKRDRIPLFVPRQPNEVWSADFMSDALYNSRRYRLFTVTDDFNREALHIEVDTSITSERLVRVFERLQQERGLPKTLRVDNGPEFLGATFADWAQAAGMRIQYIQPGKPNQNAFIERFNRTLRDEILNLYLFNDLDEVREAVHWWMIEYNEERPHDSLGDRTPTEHYNQFAKNSTFELSLK